MTAIFVAGLWIWLLLPAVLTASAPQELEIWAQGPVRWLLLPEERKELRNLERSANAEDYIQVFWERRNRAPRSSGNAYRKAFAARVEAADVLYSDEGIRGSLTDRGRALILMGSPTHVTVSTEPVMAWDPAKESEDRVDMRNVDIEIWGYRMEDLPPGVLEIWMSRKKKAAEDSKQKSLIVLRSSTIVSIPWRRSNNAVCICLSLLISTMRCSIRWSSARV